ncbi:tRNA cyclic N6-threonylcarbamoyladenosine(37) synthase TcdA [Alteromonas sp. KUL49]|uniref:tRNA cyclic N6-threonylcarbamoyladenosine(37) synthase TcdA n=1 Tax=Alteromonas sp. KUL49 TaxID=2480798 RepID=UPI00102F290A|nr:tRNA cyclic N6-threonylcarbamoyladenosine(37) synthase TcdA [Alteromonas sp. KUL49]TAP35891.1 tRNA cyclic N6-threonylcarbamoyladenosine(37) synthase TcdA [Alteromonas sp. KUL49]GEA13275.1 tRNA threonylcarbamoyladenosine dehydratase [Alteromonas sp. KUL49]
MSDNPRFGGIQRLYGAHAMEKLQQSHVAVAGIGGVGSWCAEALARSGVGTVTLIDLDDVCITNTNRQIHATEKTIGEPKVDAMAQRIKQINPDCIVHCIEDFVLPENVTSLITPEFDAVVDATDSIKAKAAMVAHCKRNKIRIVTIGGAGGQIDPTQITRGDLAKTTQDPLAAKLRSELRRFHNFSKNPKRRFGVECIYSLEQLRYPQPDGSVCYNKSAMENGTRLDCAGGFGASMAVTATFGMFAAASIINKLTDAN